jgi:hypothetical protein
MTITYIPTFKDHYLASLQILLKSRFQLILNSLFPLAGLFLIYLIIIKHSRVPSSLEVLTILATFAYTPVIAALIVWLSRRRNKTAREVQTFTFTDEGFSIEGSTFTVKLKWEAIDRIKESKSFFFLYIASQKAYFLSKRELDQSIIVSLRKLFESVQKSNNAD